MHLCDGVMAGIGASHCHCLCKRHSSRRRHSPGCIAAAVLLPPQAGVAFPCFCTDEELEAMRADAEAKKLPPIYR